jgi:hypothetical protein
LISDAEIDQCVAVAGDMALYFVGWPEQEMLSELYEIRERMKAKLCEGVSADIATLIAESFVAAVILRRREIGEPAPELN